MSNEKNSKSLIALEISACFKNKDSLNESIFQSDCLITKLTDCFQLLNSCFDKRPNLKPCNI